MKNNPVIFVYALMMLNGWSASYAQAKPSDTSGRPGHYKEYKNDKNDTANLNVNNTIQQFKSSREFAYMNDLDSILRTENDLKKDESRNTIIRKKAANDFSSIDRILNSTPMQVFFWALAFLFILFISYRLLAGHAAFRKRKDRITDDIEDAYPHELADVSKYETLITEAENAGNYNLAIRYWFLKTLKSLADKEAINFAPAKTNKEYIEEMKMNNGAERFTSLAHNYEYIWYGKFSVDADAYRRLKEEFHLFNQKVSTS